MKKLLFVLGFIFHTAFDTHAQGLIKGSVTDQNTGMPVDYATIVVTNARTNKIVTGGTTDSAGKFALNDVPYDVYIVVTEFIGYKNDTINNLIVSATQSKVTLKNITLRPLQQNLQGITVTAKTASIENKIDKLIYNPANDVAAQAGTALDLLKKVPQLSVDIDGNVELQGNANIRFLINGKPSSMFGASLADALQTIPASQIKNIEVITSPGAK